MSLTYWDPANLLQITRGLNSENGNIQCVGQAQEWRDGGSRCKWKILGPDCSEIRRLLVQMSQMKPEAVTTEALYRLARLCLCQNFHKGQTEEIAFRWETVIETAVNDHRNIIATAATTNSNTVAQLERLRNEKTGLDAEVARLNHECDKQKKLNETQKTTQARLESTNNDLEANLRGVRTAQSAKEEENANLRDQLETANGRVLIEQTKADRAQSDNQIALNKSNEQLRSCQTELAHLRRDKQAELDTANGRLQACEEERNELRKQNASLEIEMNKLQKDHELLSANLKKLRIEADAANSGEQQLAAELETRDSLLQQTRAELDKDKSRNLELQRRINSLELSEAELKESISACWLHGLWAWLGGFRTGPAFSASPKQVSGKEEPAVVVENTV